MGSTEQLIWRYPACTPVLRSPALTVRKFSNSRVRPVLSTRCIAHPRWTEPPRKRVCMSRTQTLAPAVCFGFCATWVSHDGVPSDSTWISNLADPPRTSQLRLDAVQRIFISRGRRHLGFWEEEDLACSPRLVGCRAGTMLSSMLLLECLAQFCFWALVSNLSWVVSTPCNWAYSNKL